MLWASVDVWEPTHQVNECMYVILHGMHVPLVLFISTSLTFLVPNCTQTPYYKTALTLDGCIITTLLTSFPIAL